MEKSKLKEKKWLIKSENSDAENRASLEISRALGISPIIAKLLYNRGYTDIKSAKTFLYMESEVLSDPFLLADIRPAAERIIAAVRRREKITIYGDYDVDGVTSVCTLYLYLKSKGAIIDYYIPNRAGEGYGVSNSAIDNLKSNGTSLIITVDTGITADKEVEYAKSIGVDFVITDHHECRQELPKAVAVVNPHRPDCPSTFKELAGVGVVFKLLCAIDSIYSGERISQVTYRILKAYSDLIAIGTIADVMPIREENRLIVSHGLSMVEKTERVGLAALIEACNHNDSSKQKKKKSKITSGYIGYTLAPRINAAGRIRTASIAVELFLSENTANAQKIAEELCLANKERQNEENNIMTEAYRKIEEFGYNKMPVIVLDADNWHHGVIGIVSSRITEKYSKPSILVSFEGNAGDNISDDDIGKGSGRSIKGMNLVDALCHCSDLLVKFGGHELAAGLSVTRGNLEAFRKAINEYAEKTLSEEDMIPSLNADLCITLDEINMELAEEIRMLEPYGVSNPVPSFVMKNVCLTELSGVSDGKHSRLAFSSGHKIISGMYFSAPPETLGVSVSDMVDVLFNIDINEWNNRRNVQLLVRDIKKSVSQKTEKETARDRFSEIWSGAMFSEKENIIPTRNDFALVFRYLISSVRSGHSVLDISNMLVVFAKNKEYIGINYIKLRIIIKVMQEMNFIGIEELSDEKFSFTEYKKSGKTDLEKSYLLKKLRSQQKG